MSIPPVLSPGPDAVTVTTRRLNRQRLFEAVRRLGPISRADLAKRTGMSPPSVSALVEELLTGIGLLREAGVGASNGGRPPILLEFHAEFGMLAGVDIGPRTMRFALADLQGRVVARREEETRADACQATVEQVLQGIERLVVRSGREPSTLFAIGIGAPGMTDVTAGRVMRAASLAGWTDVPLREMVERRFQAPVQVDNDANMAALGERWRGVARDADTFVFLALGAGVGAGIVLGGRLHRGHRWHAGEIGRMTLDYRDWQKDAGERGRLDHRLGGAALAGLAQRGTAPAAEELAVVLGAAVANIVAVLDPGLVVLGGGDGLSQAGPLLLGPVGKVVSRLVPNVPALAISALGDEAPLMGAVYSAMEMAEARLLAIAGSPVQPVPTTGRGAAAC